MGRKCRPVAAKGALAALGWLVGLAGFLAVGKVSLLILTAVFAVTLTLLRRSDKLRAAVMIGVFAIVGGLYAMYYQTNIYSRLTAFDGKTAALLPTFRTANTARMSPFAAGSRARAGGSLFCFPTTRATAMTSHRATA